MGKILKSVGKVFGFAGPKPPKVSTAAPKEIADDKADVKRRRSALVFNEGGVAGDELDSGQVKKRDTLLGN